MKCRLAILIPLILFGTGCPPEKPEPTGKFRTQSGLAEQAVVVVDGEEVTLGELDDRIERLPSYARSRLATVPARQKHLDAVAEFELLADEAERSGHGDDPRVVDAVKEALAEQARGAASEGEEQPPPPESLKERRRSARVDLSVDDVAAALEENQ